MQKIIPEPIQFDWDKGNINKSSDKHKITFQESEQVFFDEYRKLWKDAPHSGIEDRYILLGKSKLNRVLFTVFTIRNKLVRVISSRPANLKERKMYEEAKKASLAKI